MEPSNRRLSRFSRFSLRFSAAFPPEVRVWIDKASNEPPIACAVVEASKLALDAADIEIPFPHLQLFFDDVKAPVWKGLRELKTPDAA